MEKKKFYRPSEISYLTMEFVSFHSSHYPVSVRRDSDGWEFTSSVWGRVTCQGYHCWIIYVSRDRWFEQYVSRQTLKERSENKLLFFSPFLLFFSIDK